MNNELELFGEMVIKEVRDNTIKTCEKMVNGTMKGLTALKVKEKMLCLNEEQKKTIIWLMSVVVDLSLHNTLFMFEEHKELELLLNDKNLAEESDGLSGELYTEDGWIEKFSKQRYE